MDEDSNTIPTGGYSPDQSCGQHSREPATRNKGTRVEVMHGLDVEVISLVGNKIADFHLSDDPTVGELIDAIAGLSDGPPVYEQQLVVGEHTFANPSKRLLSDPSETILEQFIRECRLTKKVAYKLHGLVPELQQKVMKRGEGTSTLIGMRIYDAELKASETHEPKVQTMDEANRERAAKNAARMHVRGQLIEAEIASCLHASFVAWSRLGKTLPQDGEMDDSKSVALSGPLRVTLLIRHDCWSYLRLRPEGVVTHWCVKGLRIVAADGTDILRADTEKWLTSSEPNFPPHSWGCHKIISGSGAKGFFHAKSWTQDASWIQYQMNGSDMCDVGWPAEIKVKQLGMRATYATSVVLEGSMDGADFNFIARSISPDCPEDPHEHDIWTTFRF